MLDIQYFLDWGSVQGEFKDSSGVAVLTSQHHYYPFGYEMLGTWTRDTKNNNLFTGQERQYSFNLGYQRYNHRLSDPLILNRFFSNRSHLC